MDELNPARRGRAHRRPRRAALPVLGAVLAVVAVELSDAARAAGWFSPRVRPLAFAAVALAGAAVLAGVALLGHALAHRRAPRRAAIVWLAYPFSVALIGGVAYLPARVTWALLRLAGAPPFTHGQAAAAGLFPFAVALWGALVGQRWVRRPVVRAAIPGLPADVHGLRILHLSDLHVGPLFSEKRLARLARAAARLAPDLVVVTGDIVNALPQDAPGAARQLATIPARLGVWACLGNHDRFVDGDEVAAHLRAAGVKVLVNEGTLVEGLWLCGVDDAWRALHDLDRALHGKPPEAPALLLAHDPALFPEAAARGVALTFSGHTHGGQFALPFLPQTGLARVFTPFVAGLYALGESLLVVSRGVGTVVPPIRLGAAPEMATVVLERG